MSDLQKVYERANKLGRAAPIQLRWEGAGSAEHPAHLLNLLKQKKYEGTDVLIKYHAVINIYEKSTDEIYRKAEQALLLVHSPAVDGQTYEIKAEADVTRDSRSLGQNKAHIMFVRNIMPTNDTGDSLTSESDTLKEIHKGAVRNRADSLENEGALRLGMSGAPGIIGADPKARNTMTLKRLFNGSTELKQVGADCGLTLEKGLNNRKKDKDQSVSIMKNDGSNLGKKPTYYLTFVR